MYHNHIQPQNEPDAPTEPVQPRNARPAISHAIYGSEARFVPPPTAKANSFERLLLDALKIRLDAESLHLVYGVSMSMREISLFAGFGGAHGNVASPYDWEGSCLPRTFELDGKFITDSIFFGDMGSASRLRLTHKHAIEDLPDRLIVEHCKLHSALEVSFDDGIKEFQLNSNESAALYWGARGLTAKETAKEMGLNFRSIEYSLKTAKEKLGAQSLPEEIGRAHV